MTRPKLDKWYSIRTRFKIVKARIKEGEDSDPAKQYRLIIEFPAKHRQGWFPFELQLKDGERSHTNYWCRPFGEDEIAAVIEAVQSIEIRKHQLSQLQIIGWKYKNRSFEMRKANMKKSKYL